MSDSKRALTAAINSIKKKYSGAYIQVGKDAAVIEDVEPISTGSALIDNVIGIGGLPKGRIVEIYGPESSGKTTLAVLTSVQAQLTDTDGFIGYVDVEHAFHKKYYSQMGLDLERLIFSQPDSGEEALETVEGLTKSGACSVVVLDSVAGLMTEAQLNKGLDEDTMSERARLMSKSLKRIVDAAIANNTLVIFINQIRSKMSSYGNPETTMGGKTLPYFASVRLDIRKSDVIMNGKEPVGQSIKVKVIKNKVGPPFGVTETNLFFYRGFDFYNETVTVGIDNGVIEKSGAWYTPLLDGGEYAENRIQGKEGVIEFYKEHDKDFEFLKSVVFGG